jgi:cytochrome o ubiquinol oxidase subunit 2
MSANCMDPVRRAPDNAVAQQEDQKVLTNRASPLRAAGRSNASPGSRSARSHDFWGRAKRFVPLAAAATALSGCAHIELLDPKGAIGLQERGLILTALGIMSFFVLVVMVLTLVFAWRYRESNTKATYAPKWSHSNAIEGVVLAIPCLVIVFLSVLIWKTTHTLDPYRPLESKVKPVRVQVVAMDWKWLFIYPDYGVATVNKLVVPVNTPIDFELTSDTVMNSFFIPQLGSQIYAMAGMKTQLHLIANTPGTYAGLSSGFSGPGFSDMHFDAVAVPADRFGAWVQQAHTTTNVLDPAAYAVLARPNVLVQPVTYGHVAPGIFDGVVDRYMSGRMSQTALINSAPHCNTQGLATRSVN